MPEESVVVVEPSLEESVVVEESAGGEESEVGVPKPGAVPESFPVDPVAPVGLPPEESVVVVEPSLEESVAESGGEEESDVDVILEESVEESGREKESELGTALGGDSTTGCPEPVPSAHTGTVINASIQQSGICRACSSTGSGNIGPRQKSYRIRNNRERDHKFYAYCKYMRTLQDILTPYHMTS